MKNRIKALLAKMYPDRDKQIISFLEFSIKESEAERHRHVFKKEQYYIHAGRKDAFEEVLEFIEVTSKPKE